MRGVVALLTSVLVLVCAGCRLDVAVDVAMQPDGAGTVTVAARADPELVASAPAAVADLRLDDAKQAGWTVTGPARAPDGSLTMTLTKGFATPAEATAILAELNGPNGPLRNVVVTLTTSFAKVTSTLSGSVQLTGGVGAFSDTALAQALGAPPLANVVTKPVDQVLGLTVTARFPGRVAATNGTVAADHTSVSWQPSLGDGAVTTLDARFEQVDQGARDARRNSQLAWGALAGYGVALAAGVLAVVVLLRRRSSRSSRSSPS